MFIEKTNENKRGKIYHLFFMDKDYWLSFTRKNCGRGGDIHDGRQYNVVLQGKFLAKMMYPHGEVERVIFEGRSIMVPNSIPHIFFALEDSWMLEWHENKLPPFEKKQYYKPYRDLIE